MKGFYILIILIPILAIALQAQPPSSIVVEVNKNFSLISEQSVCTSGSCSTCSVSGYSRTDYGFSVDIPPVQYYYSNLSSSYTLIHTYSLVNISGYSNIHYIMRTEEATYVDPGCNYSIVGPEVIYPIIVRVENPLNFTPATQYCLNENIVLKELTNKKNASEANLEVTFTVLSGPSKVGQNITNINELTASGTYQLRASYPFYNGVNNVDKTIVVNTLPAAPTVSAPPAICAGQTAIITPSAGGSSYKFYNVSSGGTALHTGTSYTTPALSSSTTYYVASVSAAGCESAA
ncbi:MAG: hypothetical protein ACK4IY_05270, partial [Chitinophagales bacterium]